MISCKHGNYLVEFDEAFGGLHSLQDEKRNYIAVKAPIFKIALRDQKGGQELYDTGDMELARTEQTEGGFACTYEGHGMTVTFSAKIAEEISWNIEVAVPKNRVAEWVNFPQIVVFDDLKDNQGDSKILWGFNEGVEVEDFSFREQGWFAYREPKYPSEGTMGIYPAIVETQFMAYYNKEDGMYFAAHDNLDCLKAIDFCKYEEGILLQFRHYCGVNFGETYRMSYPMVVKFFRGDWHDAAQIYREWFEQNKKEGFVPIAERTDLPGWYGESPVVVTYPVRGLHDTDIMNPNKLFPYCNAMKHIERLEKEFGSKIMVLLMHWEGTAPWAPPYVWPPFGGEAALKEFIDALHERGDVLGVYCSGLGWTQQSNLVDEYHMEKVFEEKNLKTVMCLSPEQELPYSHICTAQRSGYDMCPTQEFAVDTMCEQVEHMADAGIDYIQLLDQNHGGTPYFCYSKEHGHPPVPGRWQVEAMQKLLARAQQKAGTALFGCESAAAESYIPYLLFSDNRYNLNYHVGCHVPAYSYIFHEYLNNFMGNQVCTSYFIDYDKTPDSLLERMAYSYMAGDMLTVVLNQDGDIIWNWGQPVDIPLPDQQKVKTFVKNANSWRMGKGKKYLHSGKMVKPCVVECGENTLIYPRGSMDVPRVYSSAWTAKDGGFAQFLINYNVESVECVIDLPIVSGNGEAEVPTVAGNGEAEAATVSGNKAAGMSFAANSEIFGSYRVYEDETHYTAIGGGRQKIVVKPLSVVMIEA